MTGFRTWLTFHSTRPKLLPVKNTVCYRYIQLQIVATISFGGLRLSLSILLYQSENETK